MASHEGTVGAGLDDTAEMRTFELRRRDAYRLVFGAAAAAVLPRMAEAANPALPSFHHGVASGDPRRTRVIIWTRVTPVRMRGLTVQWKVAANPDMTGVVATGEQRATPQRDFTVKVDVTDLTPGHTYYYQFSVGSVTSPIGTTRTLPPSDSTDPFAIAVFSCSNFEKGFFNAYAEACNEPDLAAVLHLGDYIYEYGLGEYVTPALETGVVTEPRAGQLEPDTEIIMIDAYHTRYSVYRSDPNLQALHAKVPWIIVYDDHESANDAWTDGAENHQPDEGSWQARKEAALRAFYNWMPVREPLGFQLVDPATGDPTQLYRSFRFGRVANIVMLDTRLAGRDLQLAPLALAAAYANPAVNDRIAGRPRTLLGDAQEMWLDEELSDTRQVWQLIGSQVLAHYQIAADYRNSPLLTDQQKAAIDAFLDSEFGAGASTLFATLGAAGGPNPAAGDAWTGYPTARARLDASLAKARNPVVLAGDSHNAWAANLRGNAGAGIQNLGVEFGTASVTSPGLEEFFVGFPPLGIAALFVQSSQANSQTDKLQYAETERRGYIRVDLARDRLTATFVFLSTVFTQAYTVDRSIRFEVLPGARKITGT
jgi:alkaline phosphatase D